MRKSVVAAGMAIALGSGFVFAAEQTWNGRLSDTKCAKSHKETIAASGAKISHEDCIAACIKAGAKYALVTKEKTYPIVNSDYPDLAKVAGHGVTVTGELTGDSIKVTKIEKHGKKTGEKQ
ncbi:MAG TPA: hypothetical protein VF376_04510 [Thermoanaerobaculia bacterium]